MTCSSGACGPGGEDSGSGCGSGNCASDDCPSTYDLNWLPGMEGSGDTQSFPIVEVEFKGGRRAHVRVDERPDVRTGDAVIVEADRGIDYGTVHLTGPMVRLRLKSRGLTEDDEYPSVLRRATPADTQQWLANRELDTETFLVGRRTIDRMNLPMKLVDVEWQFDGKKVTFYFTAEQRVDFRELVKRLARRFRTRVELRQIGARDEAARIGGIGSCGRTLCCSTWLREFRPVSTQAAKTQNLPLNPVRLSGQCGRLKCCLNYELDLYVRALRRFPPSDTTITTDLGVGTVRKADLFRERVWVQHVDGSWEDLSLDDARAALGWTDEPEDETPARTSGGGKRRRGGRRDR